MRVCTIAWGGSRGRWASVQLHPPSQPWPGPAWPGLPPPRHAMPDPPLPPPAPCPLQQPDWCQVLGGAAGGRRRGNGGAAAAGMLAGPDPAADSAAPPAPASANQPLHPPARPGPPPPRRRSSATSTAWTPPARCARPSRRAPARCRPCLQPPVAAAAALRQAVRCCCSPAARCMPSSLMPAGGMRPGPAPDARGGAGWSGRGPGRQRPAPARHACACACLPACLTASRRPAPPRQCLLQYCGESDLQLERINVYFNEATGGELSGQRERPGAGGMVRNRRGCLLPTAPLVGAPPSCAHPMHVRPCLPLCAQAATCREPSCSTWCACPASAWLPALACQAPDCWACACATMGQHAHLHGSARHALSACPATLS